MDTLLHGPDLEPDPYHPRYFKSVTVDTLRGHIYWTDSGGTDSDGAVYIGAIMRASMNGDSVEVVLRGIVCGLGGLTDIEVHVVGKTLFWGEASACYDSALNSVSLESSRSGEWYSFPVSRSYVVVAIELDIHNQMIYWVSTDLFDEPPPGILRAPLENTVSDEYIMSDCIGDIALAHTLSKIYWSPCSSSHIRRSNLDGTEIEDMIVGQGDIGNLTIDHKGGKLYWTETGEGTIRRADLDGGEVEDLLSGLVVPTSIALNFGWDVRVDVEPEAVLPDRVELQGVYANPVRESATIGFALTEPAHVTLEIYDQLGRLVEVLASGTYPSGTHQVQWNPSSQANGVYFCKMASDNRSETIVLILQR